MDIRALYQSELLTNCRHAKANQARASVTSSPEDCRDIDATAMSSEQAQEIMRHVVGSLWPSWCAKRRLVYIVRIASYWPMTQAELASAMNISQPSVNRYEQRVLSDISSALS